MRHVYLASLLFAALSAAPASGQVTTTAFPKPINTFATSPEVKVPYRTPTSIDDKALGQYMYTGQLADQSKLPGWVRFRTRDAANFEQICKYRQTVENLGAMRMGAYDTQNHKYYALFSREYSIGFYPTNFAEIDMLTGDTTTIKRFDETEQGTWYNGYYQYAMAFNPKTNELYALGTGYEFDDETGQATRGYSVVYLIDPETGEAEEVQPLDNLYWNFCFDYDGNCWLVRPYASDPSASEATGTVLDKMDQDFNLQSTVELKTEYGESYIMYYFGTMAFDYTSGDLYWLPVGTHGASSLYKVNTTTGVYTNAAYFMPGNSFVGLFIPYQTADSRKAPAQVAGLDAQPDANGQMVDTVKWTNPTLAWDKSELSGLTGVKVYRKRAGVATTELTTTQDLLANADLLATVTDVAAGQPSQWVDRAPLTGLNTYYVLATNGQGNGVLDSIRCYMGVDVPGEVTNVSLSKKGEGLSLSWNAPEKGLHNGYINPAEVTYKVTRFPDNVVVAENLAATSFDDNTLGEQQKFYYTVQSLSDAGAGAVVTTDGVMAGSALKTPIRLTFATRDDADRWTLNPYNSLYWTYIGWDGCTEDYQALGAYGSYNEAEGFVASPPLLLEAGKTYRFTTDFWTNYPDSEFDLKVGIGRTSETMEGCTNIRDDKALKTPNYYTRQQLEDMFTPTETGTYYYYFDVATHSKYNDFRLYGLSVDYVADNDMRAMSIDNIVEAVASSPNNCTVKVRNVGGKEQSKYSVKIVMDDEGTKTVVGETTDVPTLKAGEVADVPVTFTPAKDGVFPFYGVVSLEGDEDRSNDSTEAISMNVLPAGTTAWTNVVNSGEYEALSSRVPFENYSTNERTQCLYLADEVNAVKGGVIKRIGYVYDSNDQLTDRTDAVYVNIYLGHYDRDYFLDATEVIPTTELTQVLYEGEASFVPGKGNFLSFSLDNGFAYDNNRNLVVVVEKEGANTVPHAALWHVYNNNWNGTGYRSLVYDGEGAFSGTYGGIDPAVPILYLGIQDPTGITHTRLIGEKVAYSDGRLLLGGDVQRAELFTVDGKRIASVTDSSQARLNLAKGVYVVRLHATDGKLTSVKLNVK